MKVKPVIIGVLVVLTAALLFAGCTQQTPVAPEVTPAPVIATPAATPVATPAPPVQSTLTKEQVLKDVAQKGFPVYYGEHGNMTQVSGVSEDEYKLYMYYMNITP